MDHLARRKRARDAAHRRVRLVLAGLASLSVHGAVGLALAWVPARQAPVDRVLTVSFVSQGEKPGRHAIEPGRQETSATATPPVPPSPRPPVPMPPSGGTPDGPTLPEIRFPGLARAQQGQPQRDVRQGAQAFESWQTARMAGLIPDALEDPGGERTGTAVVTTHGMERCEPVSGRRVDGLYLLFDASGSMSETLLAQALACAQQYAEAAVARGGYVVVGTFARTSRFSPPTRDLTEVAFALRATTDPTATILPSRELGTYFEAQRPAHTDLVILSDGMIPNLREVLPWYRYYLELDPENRAYLFTLGSPGHPDVTAALRDIGFEIVVYRFL